MEVQVSKNKAPLQAQLIEEEVETNEQEEMDVEQLMYREGVILGQFKAVMKEVYSTQEYLSWYNSLGFMKKMQHSAEMLVPLLGVDIITYCDYIVDKLKKVYATNPKMQQFLEKKRGAFKVLQEEFFGGKTKQSTLPPQNPKTLEIIDKKFDFYLIK